MSRAPGRPAPRPTTRLLAERYLRKVLPAWYRRNRRDLPWRRTADPYRILVSETMLQQTRVAAVIPYFERFTARFPDVSSLASAPVDEVLALWAGLGYYRRARHLKRAAELIVEHHKGRVPDDPEALLSLPGVGRYTAGAVLSIAYGRRAAVLDGNVFRVFARFFAYKVSWGRPADRASLWKQAEDLVPRGRPGDFNQALMELGALVCLPREPECPRCPLRSRCGALALGRVDRYPEPRPRPKTEAVRMSLYLLQDEAGRFLLVRRAEGERMAGLWDLPSERPPRVRARKVGELRHSVLRFRYAVTLYRASCPAAIGREDPDRRLVAREELGAYALTGMAKKAIEACLRAGSDSRD